MCVADGPDSLPITGPKSIHAGDLTTLYCSAKSVPAATVMWTFDRKPTNVEEAVYVLPSVRQSDGGRYSCTAVNAATGRNQTAGRALTVVGMREIDRCWIGYHRHSWMLCFHFNNKCSHCILSGKVGKVNIYYNLSFDFDGFLN